ncbi:MAG: YitT family protein [Lachnospiraceae bacterium]|nr:YitT family protein [Lachnospiraceae bacterium]
MKKYISITVFSVLFACGIVFFLEPNHLAPGGVTGISILLHAVTGISTGTWVFAINIPILILGWWKFGGKFMISTVYSIGVVSATTNLLSGVPALTKDSLAAALAGAFLTAISIGSIMKLNATTGGLDIVVKVLRRKYPHLRTGRLYLMIDSVIVVMAILVFGNIESGIYAGITVLITSYLLDMVLYGNDEATLFYVITDCSEAVAKRLMEDLEVGVTYLKGRGAYMDKEKEIIMCATRKTQAPKLEEIVRQVDTEAFLIVTRANEIFGEGYKSYESGLL